MPTFLALLAALEQSRHEARCTCGCPPLTCATPEGLRLLMDSHAATPGRHFFYEVTR